jgi:hypothetical protein
MKKVFCEKDFNQLKNYVLSNSETPNADRCCVLVHKNFNSTMCFNENTYTVCICSMTYDIIEGMQLNSDMFSYLLSISENQDINQDRINFYENKIETETKCCDYNDDVYDDSDSDDDSDVVDF